VLSSWIRLCRASASNSSSARSSPSPATPAAASTVQPSVKTAAVSSSDRSPSSSRPTLHSTVARRVRCRSGRSTAPVPRASSEAASRASSAAGSNSRVRAAASSIASGRPSSRRQISATAAALFPVSVKPGRTAWARSTNSATADEAASSPNGTVAGPAGALSGTGSGGTGYSRSAASPSTVRLVARIVTPRQRASSSASSPAALTTCSRLSRISSHRSPPNHSASACSGDPAPPRLAPTARATASSTRPGSVTAASGTNTTPAANRSPSRSPTATASRVLPIPPGPVSVTSRAWPTAAAVCSRSLSRPMNEVTGNGRLVARSAGVRIGGKSAGRPAWVSW
jgi:hypothetical protein